VRSDLKSGRYGLAQNRLPVTTNIKDVEPEDVVDTREGLDDKHLAVGEQAIRDGQVAVVTLSAGVGSRWTEGAGVVKGLHPFSQFAGKHRSFIEVHLAKSRLIGERFEKAFPHIITTGYMTHQAIEDHLKLVENYNYPGCSSNGKRCRSKCSTSSNSACGRV